MAWVSIEGFLTPVQRPVNARQLRAGVVTPADIHVPPAITIGLAVAAPLADDEVGCGRLRHLVKPDAPASEHFSVVIDHQPCSKLLSRLVTGGAHCHGLVWRGFQDVRKRVPVLAPSG